MLEFDGIPHLFCQFMENPHCFRRVFPLESQESRNGTYMCMWRTCVDMCGHVCGYMYYMYVHMHACMCAHMYVHTYMPVCTTTTTVAHSVHSSARHGMAWRGTARQERPCRAAGERRGVSAMIALPGLVRPGMAQS